MTGAAQRALAELERLAASASVTLSVVHDGPGGQLQVRLSGAVVVDYWPLSKRRVAHVLRTKRARKATPAEAVSMATKAPPMAQERDARSSVRARRWKRRQYPDDVLTVPCHWCGIPLHQEDATVDHVIPLARGGVDNPNNYAIACRPCNEHRGPDMPEL